MATVQASEMECEFFSLSQLKVNVTSRIHPPALNARNCLAVSDKAGLVIAVTTNGLAFRQSRALHQKLKSSCADGLSDADVDSEWHEISLNKSFTLIRISTCEGYILASCLSNINVYKLVDVVQVHLL